MDKRTLCCDEVDELYTDYAEGILEPCDMVACEQHFETCEACRANLVVIKGIVSALGQLGEEEVPCGFAEDVSGSLSKIEKTLDNSPSFLSKWTLTMRKTLAFAPLVVILIIAGYFSMSLTDPVMPVKLAALEGSSERLASSMTFTEGKLILDGLKIDASDSHVTVKSGQKIEHFSNSLPAKIMLGDGSMVLLSQGAIVLVDRDRLILEQGRLDLNMAPSGVGFVITTPHADVIVRGTVYSVEVGAETKVAVSNGSVAVESRLRGGSVLLRKGDKVSVLSSGKLLKAIDTEPLTDTVIPTVTPSAEAENTKIGIGDSN